MSRLYGNPYRVARSFPRVSGDEPSADITGIAIAEFSPRERG